jgi:hypothetical protein
VITKPFSQETKQPVIAARLERGAYDALRKEAETQRRSLGSLVRIILEDYVATVSPSREGR